MRPERWQEIVGLYYAALERKPEEREAFLREGCGGNESLRQEVESLLACRPKAEKFMEPPALEAVGDVLAASPPSESVAGSAQRIHELPPEAGSRSRSRRLLPPWWIFLLSVPFATSAGFLCFWLFFGPEPAGWIGQRGNRAGGEGWNRITAILPQSPAARAGFQSGDLVLSKDLDRLGTYPQGEQLPVQVQRRGKNLQLSLTLGGKGREYWLGSEGARALLLFLDSALYLILGGILVVVRPQDSLARWGAILLAQNGVQLLLMANRSGASSLLHESAYGIRSLPAPVALPILVGMSISVMVPAGALGFLGGFPRTLLTGWRAWVFWVLSLVVTAPISLRQYWLPVYAGANGPAVPAWLLLPGWTVGAIFLAATILLLIRNYRHIGERNERRRLRVAAAGFAIGVFATALGVLTTMPWGPVERFHSAYWLGSFFDYAKPFLFALVPVCTAYAILRHRMFDIHVMVRLGLRYAAARGLILSIVPAAGLVLALDLLTHRNQPLIEIARHRGLLYAAIALGALLLHVRQKAWLNALDRRFFREHYDARRLLSAVVEDVRRAETFDQAAAQVISQVSGSLHPEFASLMVRLAGDATLRTIASTSGAPPLIPADSRLVALMQASDKPLENSQSQPRWLHQQLPPEEVAYLKETRIEWLFPVTLGATGTAAILVLGPKRSEEPYSQEDREILSAIAGSLALLLERSPGSAAVQAAFGECPECGRCYDSSVATCGSDGSGLSTWPYSLVLARRYRFERRLGRGGMGAVYQAQDTELQRRVAVKVIRSELMPGTDALARFRWEAKAAAGFDHPNVVTVYDFGVAEDSRAYLVMELLNGCSLRQELIRCGRFGTNRVLGIMSGVSSAVQAAHDRMLLHRDLKPENVFLAWSGSAELPKVLDFGLAKMMSPGTGMESIPGTAPGMLIGTLPYMSPERIRGEAPMESWDIWALAVMAFEMLTGVHPFSTLTTWGSLVAEDRFPPLADDAATLTTQLKGFFKRSLAVDPSQRPRSARQFIVELQAAL